MVKRLLKKVKKSKRGVSPIIAEILLIGLTMLAGAITFTTVYVAYNSKPPISVTIDSYSDFKLVNSNNSTKYNSFSFVLDNQGKREVELKQNDFKLFNVLNNPLLNWTISRDFELAPLQSYSITVISTSNKDSDWLTFNSTINVQLTVSALDNGEKATISSSFTIDSSVVSQGPLKISIPAKYLNKTKSGSFAILNSTVNNLTVDVLNFGHLPVNYTLEFIDSNLNLTISTQYLNNSFLPNIIYGHLPAASGNSNSSSANLSETVRLTVGLKPLSPSGNYLVMILLKIDTNIQDSLIVACQLN